MEKNTDNINTAGYWDGRWSKHAGWVKRKLKYRLLVPLFPKVVLRLKLRHRHSSKVARIASKIVTGKICDIGCGSGYFAAAYSVYSGRPSCGFDHSLQAISIAKQESIRFSIPCDFIVGDVYHMAFKDCSFGGVYMGQLIEHLNDDQAAIREAIRILEPGGKLIITIPKDDEVPSSEHVREYSRRDIEELLNSEGAQELSFYNTSETRFVIACTFPKLRT